MTTGMGALVAAAFAVVGFSIACISVAMRRLEHRLSAIERELDAVHNGKPRTVPETTESPELPAWIRHA
jgi:HAMP domain-containing protein